MVLSVLAVFRDDLCLFSCQWSRPMRFGACSVLARMRRYGPAGAGIHVTLPRGVAVQLRMSQHSCDSSFLKYASEQRTLSPRVRGSSPWRRTHFDLTLWGTGRPAGPPSLLSPVGLRSGVTFELREGGPRCLFTSEST